MDRNARWNAHLNQFYRRLCEAISETKERSFSAFVRNLALLHNAHDTRTHLEQVLHSFGIQLSNPIDWLSHRCHLDRIWPCAGIAMSSGRPIRVCMCRHRWHVIYREIYAPACHPICNKYLECRKKNESIKVCMSMRNSSIFWNRGCVVRRMVLALTFKK